MVNLCGRTTWSQATAVVERLDLLISNDSVLAHIGVATDRPVVTIGGGGHPGQFFPWWNPARHRVAWVDLDCRGCNWRCKYDHFKCIDEVSVGDVLDHARAALGVETAQCVDGGDRDTVSSLLLSDQRCHTASPTRSGAAAAG